MRYNNDPLEGVSRNRAFPQTGKELHMSDSPRTQSGALAIRWVVNCRSETDFAWNQKVKSLPTAQDAALYARDTVLPAIAEFLLSSQLDGSGTNAFDRMLDEAVKDIPECSHNVEYFRDCFRRLSGLQKEPDDSVRRRNVEEMISEWNTRFGGRSGGIFWGEVTTVKTNLHPGQPQGSDALSGESAGMRIVDTGVFQDIDNVSAVCIDEGDKIVNTLDGIPGDLSDDQIEEIMGSAKILRISSMAKVQEVVSSVMKKLGILAYEETADHEVSIWVRTVRKMSVKKHPIWVRIAAFDRD